MRAIRRFLCDNIAIHVGNNVGETCPLRIGQGLNLHTRLHANSLMGLPNQVWVSLANDVSHMDCKDGFTKHNKHV